jgi:beta-lactam-binding protein with PASTA domain
MDELGDGISALMGDDVGLYGGTKDNARCDADLLIEFLTNPRNSYKATAWASVHDIDVDEIEDYIDGLTPMVLRQDLRVTNHGFRNGEARPLQAVLEAGTAVLVDDQGIPRVRCACGNPLLEPEAVSSEVSYEGEPWAGFDPQALFRMTAGEIDERFILVDLPTGHLFERPIGGDGSTDRFLGEEDDEDDDGGVDDVEVPDVTGLTLDAAIDALEERSLKVTIVEKADDEVAPGRVVVTDPPAGAFVGPDDEILVIVSTGPEQAPAGPSTTTTTVVEETTTTVGETTTTARQTTTTRRPTTQPPPPPPTPPAQTTTTLRRTTTTRPPTTTTTRRPPPSTTTTVPTFAIPNVAGMQLVDAQNVLRQFGFIPGQAEAQQTEETGVNGIVFETVPKIGSLEPRNTVVNIKYYVGPSVEPGPF